MLTKLQKYLIMTKLKELEMITFSAFDNEKVKNVIKAEFRVDLEPEDWFKLYNKGYFDIYLTQREERRRFYKSREWQELKVKVYKRDGYRCVDCSATEDLQIDHILPISKHPELKLDLDNLCVRCRACNYRKSNK